MAVIAVSRIMLRLDLRMNLNSFIYSLCENSVTNRVTFSERVFHFPRERLHVRLHEDAIVRPGNIFDADARGEFSPPKIILKRADERMTARSEKRDVPAIRLGRVAHEQSEMV